MRNGGDAEQPAAIAWHRVMAISVGRSTVSVGVAMSSEIAVGVGVSGVGLAGCTMGLGETMPARDRIPHGGGCRQKHAKCVKYRQHNR